MNKLPWAILICIICLFAGALWMKGEMEASLFIPPQAQAAKEHCPDDQECTWAIKYNKDGTEKFRQCMPVQADLGKGMVRTDEECGDKKKPDKPTATSEIKITYTPKPKATKTPFSPNPTRRPIKTPTSAPETDNDRCLDVKYGDEEWKYCCEQFGLACHPWVVTWTPTPTQFIVRVTDMSQCPKDCLCLLVTAQVDHNAIQRERNLIMQQHNLILQDSVNMQKTMVALWRK